MAVSRAKQLEIEERRARVATLYRRGWSQTCIAKEIGVSQGTISIDLSAIIKHWRESRLDDLDAQRSVELEKLNSIEAAAWLAWDESRGTHQRRTTGINTRGEVDETVTEELAGDARFLQVALSCIDRRCKLLGLDAPDQVQVAVTKPTGLEDLSDDELRAAGYGELRAISGGA